MWRKTSIAAISVLSLVLMTTAVYAQPQAHHSGGVVGETPPQATGQGMMGQGMMGQGMMGMYPMCGGMMGKGMGGMMGGGMMGMMGRGMMGQGMGGMMGMMGDPVCGVLHQFGGPGFYGKWAGQFDLSEDQQTQLESIWTAHLKATIRKQADLKIAQLELREALDKDAPDYDGAKSRIKRINKLREEIALDHLSAIQKARKVLTPEQLKKLKSLQRMPMGGQGMLSVPQEGTQRKPQGMMGGEGMH